MRLLRFISNSQREEGIFVEYLSTLQNYENMDELFRITHPYNIDSEEEKRIFKHFDAKQWTLNEVVFFCNANNLTLQIYSSDQEDKELLIEYGDYPEESKVLKIK